MMLLYISKNWPPVAGSVVFTGEGDMRCSGLSPDWVFAGKASFDRIVASCSSKVFTRDVRALTVSLRAAESSCEVTSCLARLLWGCVTHRHS